MPLADYHRRENAEIGKPAAFPRGTSIARGARERLLVEPSSVTMLADRLPLERNPPTSRANGGTRTGALS
jgi:hypothetical protein